MMSQKSIVLFGICSLSLVVCANFVWSQQPAVRDFAPIESPANVKERIDLSRTQNGALPLAEGVSTKAGFAPTFEPPANGIPGIPRGVVETQNNVLWRAKNTTTQVVRTILEQIPADEIEEFKAYSAALEALKEAKDPEAKNKILKETIYDHLKKQFAKDLEQREKELSQVEERVRTLRKQLEKRKLAQDDIIELRLKTIANQSEGLSFPENDPSTIQPSPGENFPAYYPAHLHIFDPNIQSKSPPAVDPFGSGGRRP